jgi:hypothetical protein
MGQSDYPIASSTFRQSAPWKMPCPRRRPYAGGSNGRASVIQPPGRSADDVGMTEDRDLRGDEPPPPTALPRAHAGILRRNPHFRFEFDTSELAYADAAELGALGYDVDVLPGVFGARDRWELKARGTPEGCTPDEADKAFEQWTDARSGAYFRGHETPRTAADVVFIVASIVLGRVLEHPVGLDPGRFLDDGLTIVVAYVAGRCLCNLIENRPRRVV